MLPSLGLILLSLDQMLPLHGVLIAYFETIGLPYSVALCCASIAAPVPEICSLKVHKYALCHFEKTAIKDSLPVWCGFPHTIHVTQEIVTKNGNEQW